MQVQPYVVKLDRPLGTMLSIPQDSNFVIRAELCFGQRASVTPTNTVLWPTDFTRMCMPQQQANVKTLRFGVGDRVACAVEDSTDNFSVWAAGTVTTVGHPMPQTNSFSIPYCVQLDIDCTVLVHRDEDWLVRDLNLQPEGVRQGQDGTRCLNRFLKRERSDGSWEIIDHRTRNVRRARVDSE